MQSSSAGKPDITINPVTAIAAVLIPFWGTIAVLLWCLF
jgi:hypothetical protein